MKLSHSKMQLMLKDPMSYHIKYDLGISAVETKPALKLGSAVHWGLEHSTDNLDEFFNDPDNYTEMQSLAEAMVAAYLKHKDEIFNLVLAKKDGSYLKPVKEQHELFIDSDLKSYADPSRKYSFIGIADLLIETDEGLVLIDYKTSSKQPDWNGYLEQIYRYIFMLRNVFPDKKVCKIGIINLRKASLRQRASESKEEYAKRMKDEYVNNESKYIYVHMFSPEDLDSDLLNAYIENLSKMADMCNLIATNHAYYINFGAQEDYGKAEYYDIFYRTPGAYSLYDISDTILDDKNCIKTQEKGGRRLCNELDIDSISEKDSSIVMNNYDRYKSEVLDIVNDTECFDEEQIADKICEKYKADKKLLHSYWLILQKELDDAQVIHK